MDGGELDETDFFLDAFGRSFHVFDLSLYSYSCRLERFWVTAAMDSDMMHIVGGHHHRRGQRQVHTPTPHHIGVMTRPP